MTVAYVVAVKADCPVGRCRISFPCLGCQGDGTLLLPVEEGKDVFIKPVQGGGCRGGEWVETRAPRDR